MAIQRSMSITLNVKDGDPISFTGDEAQRIYQEYVNYANGGINRALKYTNADGKQEYIQFSCLCGITVDETTETEVPDVECEQVDCIADYPSN